MDKFYLDANGTDGSDPTRVDRVYPDGTRIPLSDTDWKAEKLAELKSKIVKVQDEKLTLPELREAVAALVEFLEV